jgi:Ca-activated chloride channel family protein
MTTQPTLAPRPGPSVVVVLALCLWPLSAAAQAQPRALHVSVVDRDGAPVAGLGRDDLEVREDGLAREVLSVEPLAEPMQIALVVDNTQAAQSDILNIRDALTAFVNLLATDHEMSIVTFGDRPTLLLDATRGADAVTARGVKRLFMQPNSGSYLLDAIVDVTKGFSRREAVRPVIVALSLEGPEFSSAHHDRVIEALAGVGAQLHVITIGAHAGAASLEQAVRSRNIVFDRGTQDSGGWYENVLTSQALESMLTRLAGVLTSQYEVTYARPESLIPPERVAVTVNRPEARVRRTVPRREGPSR